MSNKWEVRLMPLRLRTTGQREEERMEAVCQEKKLPDRGEANKATIDWRRRL